MINPGLEIKTREKHTDSPQSLQVILILTTLGVAWPSLPTYQLGASGPTDLKPTHNASPLTPHLTSCNQEQMYAQVNSCTPCPGNLGHAKQPSALLPSLLKALPKFAKRLLVFPPEALLHAPQAEKHSTREKLQANYTGIKIPKYEKD